MSATHHIVLYSLHNSSFHENVASLLEGLRAVKENIVRVVIFAAIGDNADYTGKFDYIQDRFRSSFGDNSPLFSLIAQPPLECKLAAEVHTITAPIVHHSHYITTADGQSLFATITPSSVNASILEQSQQAFQQLGRILATEKFPISSIVRQWNYIERITDTDALGQRYQQFNDARSAFYAQTEWENGYPAATGIGTFFGGVTIDLDASHSTDIQPIDNPLQVAAHHYSSQVLVNGPQTRQSSPKFERAKRVDDTLYISGTAAIRGEQTIVSDVLQQTSITVDNIQALIRQTSVEHLSYIRVYVKHPSDISRIQRVIGAGAFLPLNALYIQTDICRPELLLEIEGIG